MRLLLRLRHADYNFFFLFCLDIFSCFNFSLLFFLLFCSSSLCFVYTFRNGSTHFFYIFTHACIKRCFSCLHEVNIIDDTLNHVYTKSFASSCLRHAAMVYNYLLHIACHAYQMCLFMLAYSCFRRIH